MAGKLSFLAALLITPIVTQLPQQTPQAVEDPRRLLEQVAAGLEYDQSGDPEPARRLAALFAQGQGVEQDAALACAFATRAGIVTRMTWPRGEDHRVRDARQKEAVTFSERFCSGLSPTELKGAHEAIGCFAVGMPTQIIPLGDVSILVDRSGIGILDRPLRPGLPNCPVVVSGVRPISAMPAAGAPAHLRPRHFVETLYWVRAGRNGRPTFVLHLYVQELLAGTLEPRVLEPLHESTTWPEGDVDVLSWYDLHRDGRVRYELAGAVEKHGWIGRNPPTPHSGR